METLEFALKYVKRCFSVIPLKPGTKIPVLGSWEPYQRKLAPNELLEVWFSNGHAANNIAIVTGKISRIIAFDIDGEEALARFNRAVESLDDQELKTAVKETMRIRTASGNTNVVVGFRIEEFTSADDDKLLGNRVLWTNGKHSEIRVKGEGGYVVAAPSLLENGNRYEVINCIDTVIILSKTQINALISAIQKQTQLPINYWGVSSDLNEGDIHHIVYKLRPYYQHGNRNDFTMYLSGWMRKEGIAFNSAIKVTETIAADDEEKPARIKTLEETYKKQDLEKVCGYSGLLSIIINQTQDEEKAKQILREVKSLFPKTEASKEEYKSQRQSPVELDKNWEEKEKENNNKRTDYVQKHHDGDLLAEAIVIGRRPYFAVAAPKVGKPEEVSIILQDSIQIDETTILKPLELTSYINKPYTFKSEQEFFDLVENTRGKNLDGLYRKVKSTFIIFN